MRKLPMLARLVAVGACAIALTATARADDEADDAKSGPAHGAPAAPVGPAPPAPSPAAPAGPLPAVGFADRMFIRTPGDEVVLFPDVRLQVDGGVFPRQTPKSGAYIRRARVGLAGWLAGIAYFDVAVDLTPAPADPATVAPAALSPPDDYLALVPAGDRLILQAGQFDVPFTLENRTSDAYTDFIERSMAVRLLGAPRNKDVGGMAAGLVGGLFYYSVGLFDGEGAGQFRNLDNQADAIGRIVAAPWGFRHLAVGGSGWYGNHVLGPEFSLQATPGGVTFFNPRWVTNQTTPTTIELREHGISMAVAGELNLPLSPRLGVRAEAVYRNQQLAEADVSLLPAGPIEPLGAATLSGIAGYGELWFWILGDDRLLPAPGLELPARLGRGEGRAFDDGLMFAVRAEVLKEDLTSNAPTLGDPNRATTRVVSGTVGINYWRGSMVRLSVNYIANYWSGTSENIKVLQATSSLEHEVLLRFAMCL
jgi:hypothetical protein